MAVVLAAVGCSDGRSESDGDGTRHVDEAASAGGDGSQARPFQTVREALEDERPKDAISIAPGRYGVPPSWTFDDSLTIRGESRDTTILEAESGASLEWTGADGSTVALHDLGFEVALGYSGGRLDAQDVTFADTLSMAVALRGTDTEFERVRIRGVTRRLDDNRGDGVIVQGGSFSWTGGSAASVADRALVMENAVASLQDLDLSSFSRAPLTVDQGSDVEATRITVSDVEIGVFVNNARLSFADGEVRRAATAGMLTGPGSSVTVLQSTFADCPNGHVAVGGMEAVARFESSRFENAEAGPCVAVNTTDASVVVKDSIIDGCAGGGVTFFGAMDGAVEGTEIRNVRPDPMFPSVAEGISLIDSAATLSGNTIANTDSHGVGAVRSVVIARDNVIGPAEGAGISLVEPSPSPSSLHGNRITRALGAGILFLEADGAATDNTVSETRFELDSFLGEGILFAEGATVTVTGNTLRDNARNGVLFLDGASGEVRDNEATDNDQYGVREICDLAANSVTVGTNDLRGNALGDQLLCGG